MKKLLGFLVLVLFITGCSNKKESALENCADNNFLEKKKYQKYLVEDEEGTGLFSTYASLENEWKKIDKKGDKYWDELKKHEKEKGYTTDKTLNKLNRKWHSDKTDENWMNLKNYEAEIGYASDEERKRLNDLWYSSRKQRDKKREEIKEYLKIKSKEILSEIKFDNKININSYYEIYKKCEIELEQTSTAFLKRWGG